MTYDPENIFAKIIRGDLPCHKVYEDEQTLSFMDLFPQTKGHTLVIPKTGGVNIHDTSHEDLAATIHSVKRISAAVNKAFNPDGIMVGQFNGAPAGQTVFHLHFHIIPRYEDMPMKGHGNATQADPDELASLAKLIAENL